MLTLLDIQRAVGVYLTGGSDAAAAFVIDGDISAEARLAIYRNTFTANLVGALRISYPAVRRLVGEEFFEGAARAFVDEHPPRTAYLNVYGAEFTNFLAKFPPAASLAYLPDVARLEWAVNIALHAEDAPPLDPTRLASLNSPDIVFTAHPSVTLVKAASPADAIWRAVIDEDDDALAGIDPSAGPVFLIVGRTNDMVLVERVDASVWQFTARLCAGVPLSAALDDADMSTALAAHFAAGRFTDVRICTQAEGNAP